MEEHPMMPPEYSIGVQEILSEIFDMVKPRDPFRITRKEFMECHCGHTIVGVLFDTNGFLDYENREQFPPEDDDEELSDDTR
eukprot:m.164180 g.164180  ORF g.164180 m.164180 type:complete len:82 (-) comp14398_c0_seq3:349-594(-)